MKRISNTRRNRNILRLAAVGAVVLLETMFGGHRYAGRTADAAHSMAAAEREQPVVVEHRAIQGKSSGGQKSQLSLMIFRSN